jgi:preprotein translocase subunit SecD
MNRYSRWKYILILVSLVLALLYSLPNWFGEVPAVQVSPAKAVVQVNAQLLDGIENKLKEKQIPYLGAAMDTNSVKVRFADTTVQLQARDALAQALGENYTVALNLQPASPAWMASVGAMPMSLGLDLRGGVHFLMQVDMDQALDKQLDRRIGDVRASLRDAKIPLAGVGREGKALVVRFKDGDTRAQGAEQLRKDMRDMTITPLDETRLSLAPSPVALKAFEDQALQQNVLTLRNRVNELGVSEPVIQQQGSDRVSVELAGVQDTAKAKEIVGRTATLELRLVDEDHVDGQSLANAAKGLVPPGDDYVVDNRTGQPYLIKKQVFLTGENISNASQGFDSRSGEPSVNISFDTRGAKVFAALTRDNVGKRIALLLIEKGKAEVASVAVIRTAIEGGQTTISGRMDVKEASDTALLLRAGSLAAPMEIIEERTIGPSLGADNIAKGVSSVLWGFVAIAIFMAVYYRVIGVFSVIALGCNVLLLVALLSLLQATLTLPGIAAIALTVGMAIDANVLINERVREELRLGHTPHAAIHAGYDRAFATILDSNVTNFIAGIALIAFGSGPVKGFAVVLCLGILTSMFSAILVSRALVNLTYGRQRKLTKIAI